MSTSLWVLAGINAVVLAADIAWITRVLYLAIKASHG